MWLLVASLLSQELGTKSEPSRKLANTVAAVAAKPPQARAASPEIRGPSSEAPSCPSPAAALAVAVEGLQHDT